MINRTSRFIGAILCTILICQPQAFPNTTLKTIGGLGIATALAGAGTTFYLHKKIKEKEQLLSSMRQEIDQNQRDHEEIVVLQQTAQELESTIKILHKKRSLLIPASSGIGLVGILLCAVGATIASSKTKDDKPGSSGNPPANLDNKQQDIPSQGPIKDPLNEGKGKDAQDLKQDLKEDTPSSSIEHVPTTPQKNAQTSPKTPQPSVNTVPFNSNPLTPDLGSSLGDRFTPITSIGRARSRFGLSASSKMSVARALRFSTPASTPATDTKSKDEPTIAAPMQQVGVSFAQEMIEEIVDMSIAVSAKGKSREEIQKLLGELVDEASPDEKEQTRVMASVMSYFTQVLRGEVSLDDEELIEMLTSSGCCKKSAIDLCEQLITGKQEANVEEGDDDCIDSELNKRERLLDKKLNEERKKSKLEALQRYENEASGLTKGIKELQEKNKHSYSALSAHESLEAYYKYVAKYVEIRHEFKVKQSGLESLKVDMYGYDEDVEEFTLFPCIPLPEDIEKWSLSTETINLLLSNLINWNDRAYKTSDYESYNRVFEEIRCKYEFISESLISSLDDLQRSKVIVPELIKNLLKPLELIDGLVQKAKNENDFAYNNLEYESYLQEYDKIYAKFESLKESLTETLNEQQRNEPILCDFIKKKFPLKKRKPKLIDLSFPAISFDEPGSPVEYDDLNIPETPAVKTSATHVLPPLTL